MKKLLLLFNLLLFSVLMTVNLQAQIALPYTETFSSITAANGFPTVAGGAWTRSGTTSNQPTYIANQASYNRSGNGDTKYMCFNWASGTRYYFVGPFNLTAGVSYTSSCLYKADGSTGFGPLQLTWGTTAAAGTQTNVIATIPADIVNASFNTITGAFTVPTTGSYYLAVKSTQNGNPWYLTIDDFKLNVTPTCFVPTALTNAVTSTTSANHSWSAPSSGTTPSGYEWAVTTSATPPASGTATAGLTSSSTGLAANTTHYLHVRSDCGGGDISSWATSSFYTGYCNPAPSSVDASGITNVTFGASPNIVNNTTGTETNNYGNYSAQIGDGAQGTTLNVNITFSTGYTYGTKIWIDWNNDLDFNDAGELMYTGLSASPNPSTLNASFTVPLAAAIGNYRMRIGGTDDDTGPSSPCYTGTYGSFEDYTLNVTPAPACSQPTALAISSITSTSAQASWTTGGAVVWVMEYGPTGFAHGAGTIVTTATNPETLTLTPGTTYDFYVRDFCSVGDSSAWSGPVTFTNIPGYTCGLPVVVNSYPYTNSTTTCGAGNDYGIQCGGLYGAGEDFVYQLDITTLGNYEITVSGPTTYTGWFLKDAADCANGAACLANATSGSGTTATAIYNFTAAGTYYLIVDHWPAPTCGAFTLTINPPTAAPGCSANEMATPGACSNQNLVLSWDAAATATAYKLKIGTSTGATDILNNVNLGNVLSYTFAAPNVSTQYFWTVTPTNIGGDATGCTEQTYTTGTTPCVCIPAYGATATDDGDLISAVSITGTTLNNVSGTTASGPSYTYYNGGGTQTGDLQAGTSYTVVVSNGAFGSQNMAVWIDFNDNAVFETSERIGYTTTAMAANTTASFTISLPCNPSVGVHRMRVRDVWNTAGSSIDPCAYYGWGETEDYDVNVLAPPACPQISALAASNVLATSADLSWVLGCTETAWDIHISNSATPPAGVPAVVGHTALTYNATSLTPSTLYYAHVRANCGGGTSTWSTISFTTTPLPPANDDCAGAVTLTVNPDFNCGAVSAGTVNASTASAEANTCGGTDDDDVWFKFTATNANHRISLINITGSTSDMYFTVYEGTGGCGALGTQVICSDNETGNLTGLTIGTLYYVRVYTWTSTPGQTSSFNICVGTPPPPPANDDCATAITLACGAVATVNTVSAASDNAMGACGTGTGGTPEKGVWYKFVGTGEDIQVSLCASNFDTKLHIYESADGTCGTLTCLDSNDDGALCAAFSLQSSITFTSTLGTTYYLLPGGYGTASGNLEISISCIPVGVVTWLGSSSDYSLGTNWSSGTVPTCADDIYVPLTANAPVISGAFECNDFGTASSVAANVTIAGTLGICGDVSLANNTNINGPGAMTLTGNNGGTTFGVTGNANVNRLVVQDNYAFTGNLNIINSLVLDGGNVVNGGSIKLKSNATGTAYLDDFTGAGGTINSITQERYVTTGVGLGQRLFGSSVQSGAINGLDGTYAGGYPLGQVMPDVCGVSLLQGSPYSNMFEWHEDASFAGCNIAGWYAISQGTAMTPGRGYSGWMNDGSIISVTGAPNTGTVSFVTTDVSGSGLANADGWHLLSNPYPSPLDVNAFINSGFTSPQYYDASSGAYYGTFTPVLLTGELASMQGFFAESTGAGTVSVTNADRVASTTTAWYSTSSLFDQMLTIDVMGNGFADKTYVYFSDDQQVTNNFDGAADSKKRSSNVGQPTIYTALGAERMALNGYPESSLGQSIGLGVDHGANGSFELSFAGMDQFDTNTAIYLEDVQEGVYHNIANGNYSYTALASDNSDRFMLHFVLPVALNTVNANCEGEMGRIELASTNGTANRDYVIADANTTIAAGSLANLANDVNAGTYTVFVNDAFGGNQTYTVTVGQDEPINAIYTVSSTDVQVGEMVNFANLTANTTNVSWTIASATINGVNNPTYTFDEVGTYNVVLAVSNGVCSDEKAFTVNVSNKTTSINTLSKDNMVKVFGSENVVSVEFNNNFNKNATVEIQNVLGQKAFAGSVEAKGVQNISLSNITTGYYFVTVTVNEERITAKVFLSKK